jgi:ankyrin repeat protein
VSKKSLEMVKFLEAHGANLNHREMLLRTPLYFAASQGSNHIIKYLIEKGCDVNVPSNLGRTALGKACWNGEPEVV